MHLLTRARGVAILLLITILALTAACGGSDDKTPTPTTGSTASSPTVSEQSASPDTALATVTMEATAKTEASPTSGSTATRPAASPTTAAASTTSTSEANASPTTALDEALGDVKTIDPELLPNFTLNFTMDASGTPDGTDSSISFQIEQSAIDQYHMKINAEGTNIEVWKVGDTTYLAQDDGQVMQLPAGTDTELFSPSLFLQTAPAFPPEMNVEKEGDDTVSGRSTTHYRVAGKDFLQNGDFGSDMTVSDVTGDVDLWIDKELNIALKYAGDVTWKNADSTPGTMKLDYEINQIGDTPDIQAPATQ